MKRLFISRDLKKKSPFHQALSSKFRITALSLIDFKAIPFNQPNPDFDWLFFYSKNGVKYFFESFDKKNQLPPIAAMGKGTAATIVEQGYSCAFIGKGNPQDVSEQFLALAKHQRVLFIQAKNSKQSIQKILGNTIDSQSLVVYNNTPKKSLPPHLSEQDVLVFTSPLNVKSYLAHFSISHAQIVVSMGTSTSDCLLQNGISSFHQTRTPSEQGLIDLIQSL